MPKVKNKMPAEVQITAEQIVQESKVRSGPLQLVVAVADPEELKQLQSTTRKRFEDCIRKNRCVISNWIKYARWEEVQQEYERARSIYERAFDVDHHCITLWLKYVDMELKIKQINHARNIFDRAVAILPRVGQLWLKYAYMEEMLGNIPNARRVFEKWMEWEPEEQAWLSYIKMELRYKEINKARLIYEQFILIHPKAKNWICYARFEESQGFIDNSRNIFERAIEFFGDEDLDEKLYIAFARFEESCQEYNRSRTILKYALDNIRKPQAVDLFKAYNNFERKYGKVKDLIVIQRKFQYENDLQANPNNYDGWIEYIRFLECGSNLESTREVYERAIANIPRLQEKTYWERYIYLWINYALYEELIANDISRTREVYRSSLKIIPHTQFTFGKVWVMYAKFEIRQKELATARKVLGTAIGKCPKPKLFKGYIELELQLREFDRCRKIYEKYLEYDPGNSITWIKYAELEAILGDVERSRAIYNLAIEQPLDLPEVLWKSFIDFETEQGEYDFTRILYSRLLERTQHVKVWLSFAKFEASLVSEDAVRNSRSVYSRADEALKLTNSRDERVMLLEAWLEFERDSGDKESLEKVKQKLPNKVKKRLKVYRDDGSEGGWEEYWDYIFPDDSSASSNLRLIQMAKFWKQKGSDFELKD